MENLREWKKVRSYDSGLSEENAKAKLVCYLDHRLTDYQIWLLVKNLMEAHYPANRSMDLFYYEKWH